MNSSRAAIVREAIHDRGKLAVGIDLPPGYVDLGVEFLSQGHEDVLVAKHPTLEVDDVARIFLQPANRKKNYNDLQHMRIYVD